MLGFFIAFLTVVLVIVSALMTLIVLMQRPKQEGLGAAFGGGVTDQMWGAQTTNVLQRGTVYLAVMFFVITMILAVLVNAKQRGMKDFNREMTAVTPDSPSDPVSTPALTAGPGEPGGTTIPNPGGINITPGTGEGIPPISLTPTPGTTQAM